jgi:hypothetical protein
MALVFCPLWYENVRTIFVSGEDTVTCCEDAIVSLLIGAMSVLVALDVKVWDSV